MSAVHHPIFARCFAWMARHEPDAFVEHRRKTVEGLSGRVLEIGAGSGANFPHYDAAVTTVVAVEPEEHLRHIATHAARSAPVPVEVIDGVAESLPFEDASFDAGVASLVLCSVRDPARSLAELYRVIRPGGELRFYEHVVSERAGHAKFQSAIAPAWRFLAGGCHTNRDTVAAIERAGFQIQRVKRFDMEPVWLTYPVSPHAAGRALRPA
jgi:ubiquinone/menaquinone biosynthesis C-methylase UbiE